LGPHPLHPITIHPAIRIPAEEKKEAVRQQEITCKINFLAQREKETFVCLDANKEVETVKHLYDSLLEAKRSCGEPTEDFSFPRFHRLIASKADGLKERLGCERVKFSVVVEAGHVSFKARADKESEDDD